jgi:hypothetical protein
MKLKLKPADANTLPRSAVEFAESLDLGMHNFSNLASDGRKRAHLNTLEAMGYISFVKAGETVRSWAKEEERHLSVCVGQMKSY